MANFNHEPYNFVKVTGLLFFYDIITIRSVKL